MVTPDPSTFVHIVGLSKVYDPGCHCAFTDIIHWRGRVWLTFREALNHSIHPSSQIVVMASANHGHSFDVLARIAARGLDVRDPHFYIVDDRLHLTMPCWKNPPADSKTGARTSILARSDDGHHWDVHREIDLFETLAVWRPAKHPTEDAWYAAAYCDFNEDQGCVKLLKTRDGLAWQEVSIIESRHFPNETELCFLADGSLLALVRREEAQGVPLVAKARPPYTQWTKVECDRWFKGPLLTNLGDGRLLAVGRVNKDEQHQHHVTRLHALDPETGKLHPGLTLESGNDCSYAGFIRLPAEAIGGHAGGHNALLSYYSGHGSDAGAYRGGDFPQRCAIYVARLVITCIPGF